MPEYQFRALNRGWISKISLFAKTEKAKTFCGHPDRSAYFRPKWAGSVIPPAIGDGVAPVATKIPRTNLGARCRLLPLIF